MTSAESDRFYLDSNTVIAIVERQLSFTDAQEEFLKGIDAGRIFVVSSEIARTECLVKPIRDRDDLGTRSILKFFQDEQTLPLVPIDRSVFIRAAELRALDYLSLPDAIHVSCALKAGCSVFISADKRLRMPNSMRRVPFDDLAVEMD